MENVEYFVMPLTAGYFDDFWDENNNCPDKHSITYKEISAALNRNCKFICIEFPEFVLDDKCLEKLFGKQYNRISTAIKRKFIRVSYRPGLSSARFAAKIEPHELP